MIQNARILISNLLGPRWYKKEQAVLGRVRKCMVRHVFRTSTPICLLIVHFYNVQIHILRIVENLDKPKDLHIFSIYFFIVYY